MLDQAEIVCLARFQTILDLLYSIFHPFESFLGVVTDHFMPDQIIVLGSECEQRNKTRVQGSHLQFPMDGRFEPR